MELVTSAGSKGVTRDLTAAQKAYTHADAGASKAAHDGLLNATEGHDKTGDWIKSMVYGGLDGIITTFAVVAGASGGGLGTNVILILGFSNMFADALSMGVGDALSTKAENDRILKERKREAWELANYKEGEIKEMVEMYVDRGMSHKDAEACIRLMAKYEDFFVNVMMVEELGLTVPEPEAHCDAMKDGFLMFLAFCVFGAFPLLGYALLPQFRPDAAPHELFLAACAVTGVTLFALGAVKAKFVNGNPYKLGAETLALGALCASSAYSAGALLQQFLPS